MPKQVDFLLPEALSQVVNQFDCIRNIAFWAKRLKLPCPKRFHTACLIPSHHNKIFLKRLQTCANTADIAAARTTCKPQENRLISAFAANTNPLLCSAKLYCFETGDTPLISNWSCSGEILR